MIWPNAQASALPMTTAAFMSDQAGKSCLPVHAVPFQRSAIVVSTFEPWLANTQALDGELAAVTVLPTDVLNPLGGAMACHPVPAQCAASRLVGPHGFPQLSPVTQALPADVAVTLSRAKLPATVWVTRHPEVAAERGVPRWRWPAG